MAVVLVAYGYSTVKHARFKAFLKGAGLGHEPVFVVENHLNTTCPQLFPTHWSYLQGSNQHFEFSGYLEGIEACKSLRLERVYIFNDTLFAHHYLPGWAALIRRSSRRLKPGIYGDPRIEPVHLESKPLRIYASWHFALIGKAARVQFEKALGTVLERFDSPIQDPVYQTYLTNYLEGSWLRGYTNPALLKSEDHLKRKKHCIYTEHRLGRALEEQGLLHPYPSRFYRLVRRMDRLLAVGRRVYKKVGKSAA
jgi:hypothetical protein